MKRKWFRKSMLMSRPGLAGLVLALGTARSMAAAPLAAGDGLSGTWQVQRTCVSGCVGTVTLTEQVSPFQGRVFMATGTAAMVLYRIGGKKVLVHAPTSSSLLRIRVLGQLMEGAGVDRDGSTFSVTWSCVSAPEVRQLKTVHRAALPAARGIC